MEDKITMKMDSGEILEIKAMGEVGIGQMIGNLEVMTEGTIEVLATVHQGQVPEQIPLGIELHVLSVGSMIILQETAQQCKQTER